jgi:anti-sigma factor RsiW
MTCDELLRTQAFIDGELDDAASRDAQRHMEGCEECQTFVASAAATSDLLRKAQRHTAPASLRAKVLADLRAAPAQTAIIFRQPPRWRGFWLGAGSGASVMALVAAFALFVLLPPSVAALGDDLVDAHTAALMSGHAIQVVSSNHHTVKPWFAGRIAVSPPVADFAGDGFTLVGGRIERVKGIDMAVVVYRHGAHVIDLYSWADQGAALAVASSRHGYTARFWKQRDLNFAAVSDVESDEMEKFEHLVQSVPE